MQLQAYLDRIGFKGVPRRDLETLFALHRGHLLNVPYENLDVLLGRSLDFDLARIFDKLVTQRRGGWCYEMNGLLAWALEEIGFDVVRLAGGVVRETLGDFMVGNHLVLLVQLDEPWIADVGFGDGLFEPTPLREGPIAQRGFVSTLSRAEDGWWRYTNHQHGGAPSFDFRAEAADPAVLAERCTFLQTSENSPFTQYAVLQRHTANGIDILRNSIRIRVGPESAVRSVIGDADAYVRELRDTFGLDLPEAAALWPLAESKGLAFAAENPDFFA